MKRDEISAMARSVSGRRDPYWGTVVLEALRSLEALERAEKEMQRLGVTNPTMVVAVRNAQGWAREAMRQLASGG